MKRIAIISSKQGSQEENEELVAAFASLGISAKIIFSREDGQGENFSLALYRIGGPAIIHPDGRGEWWLDGKKASLLDRLRIKGGMRRN